MRKIDIIGKRFTRLMVISKVGSDKWGHLRYSCLCDCGKQKVLTTSMLTSGNTKSCGCLFRDVTTPPAKAGGFSVTPQTSRPKLKAPSGLRY